MKLFISYAREDQDIARILAAHFSEQGYSVWWDQNIQLGSRFAEEVERALVECDLAVVLWSPASLKSDWVKDEAHTAMIGRKLLPILVNGTTPPLGYRQLQGISISNLSQIELNQISSSVRSRFSGTDAHFRNEQQAEPKSSRAGDRFIAFIRSDWTADHWPYVLIITQVLGWLATLAYKPPKSAADFWFVATLSGVLIALGLLGLQLLLWLVLWLNSDERRH